MSSYYFPEDIVGNQQYQHTMVIKSFKLGRNDDRDNPSTYKNPIDQFYMFIPGGGQSSMSWQQQHEYTDVKLMRLASAVLGSEQLLSAVDTSLGILSGQRLNPKIDVLYRTTNLREYIFTFLMAPTSETESNMMKNICNRLRWSAAPQQSGYLPTGLPVIGGQSMTFDFPCEFTIEFMYKDKNSGQFVENRNIPRISPGVIKEINVDYTPQGEWSTFYNGHPVSSLLQFRFMETRIIDKSLIDQGY